MKKTGFTTILGSLLLIASGMLGYGQTLADSKAGKQLFESVDTYNYNVLASKFLTDENKRYLGDGNN